MKKIHICIVIITYSILLCIHPVMGQEKINNKGQYEGIVIIKFTSDQTQVLDKAQKNVVEKGKMNFSKKEGYVKTGIPFIDRCSKKLEAYSMKRVFRPAGKFEEKHRKHGLHLWYEVIYKTPTKVDDAINIFKESTLIETAHARYKAELSDGYSGEYKVVEPSKKRVSTLKKKALNFTGSPNDPEYPKQWHYHNTGQAGGVSGSDIDLERAWTIEKGNSDVIVAVMDTGVQPDHPDLKRNMWVNKNEIPGNGIDDDDNGYIDDIHGYDFVFDTGELVGDDHATHVAGTIAAETNNGIGVAGVAGGTGNGDGVKIMSCRIIKFGFDGLEESYVYAADHGAVISQNSWHFSKHANQLYQSEINATRAGIDYFIENAGGPDQAMDGGVVVFAMGNENEEYSDSFPHAYKSILNVGSTDNTDRKSDFSNFGNWGEVFAPGGDNKSGGSKESRIMSTLNNSGYGYLIGTSMAAPHVSGLAALLISKHYGNITNDQVKALIQGGADPLDHLNPGYEGKLGTGRINAYTSLTSEVSNIPINIILQSRTETDIQIQWDNIPSASGYDIRYKKIGASNWTTVLDINTNFYKASGLTKGTEYHFQVRSKGNLGTSLYSERKIFWSYLTNQEIPKNVRFSERRKKETKVNWDAIAHADRYELSYKKSEEQQWVSFVPRSNFRVHLINLKEGNSYQVRVRAIYGDMYSEYSPIITYTPHAPICNDFEPWNPNKVYHNTNWPEQGYLVVHNNNIYENKHYTQNQEPGVSSAWKKLEACSSGGNISPTVTITSPTNNQVIEQETLSAITLVANASDPDGSIASIQFDVNGINLASGNTISWTPTAFGDYTIKVTVTDDQGATATDQIGITIKKAIVSTDCQGIPAWDATVVYPSEGGVKVSHKTSIYKNKWWTQNNEPGTGGAWGPWELIGPCESSINKSMEAVDFTISPNPATNRLNLRVHTAIQGAVRITLYDLKGQQQVQWHHSKIASASTAEHLSYDISMLSNGLYLVKITNNGKYHMQKLIVE